MILTVNLASLDIIRHILRAAAVDLAADRERGTQDLADGAAELLGEAAEAHGARDVDDVVQGDRLVVLDVLLLLAVTGGLLQGLDDQRRRRRHNRDLGLTVLDGELDRDTEAFLSTEFGSARLFGHHLAQQAGPYPVTRVLGNVFTNLLGRQTKRSDLGSQSRLSSDLTTGHPQVAING